MGREPPPRNGRFAPGARSGPVIVTPRARSAALSLEAELEGVLMDAVGGDPPGPALAKRLERVAREVLLRHRLGAARVLVRSDAHETVVHVLLPEGPSRVRELALRVDHPG